MNTKWKTFLCIRGGVKPEPSPLKAGLSRHDKAGIIGVPFGISHAETSGTRSRSYGKLHFLILNIYLLIGIFPLVAFPEDLCRYLSQEGGLISNTTIATGNYIYHRNIVFQAQTRSKPVSIEISYIYQSMDSDSITIKYQRIEKKKWGQDFLRFREPVEGIIDLPFNKDKRATLRIKEEPLGNYVIQNKSGGIVEGFCSNEPGINVLLFIDNNKRLTAKKQ